MNILDRLAGQFSKLPGIGKKSAARLVYHILESDPAYARALAADLVELHTVIKKCAICGAWTESDPCPICQDNTRDGTVLCVVEKAQDVRVIEGSREFHGRFHVLGGLIAPLDGIHPHNLTIESLLARVERERIAELVLALNPTIEGDTTALYIQKQCKERNIAVELTRLASGLPVGGDLEYADKFTLSRSFRHRVTF